MSESDVKGNYYLSLGYLECDDINESKKVLLRVFDSNRDNIKF